MKRNLVTDGEGLIEGSNRGFMSGLHGLRGIAAVAVLMFHWSSFFPAHNAWIAQWRLPSNPWINPSLLWAVGWQGVYLFFVLSGFLLASQWLEKKPTPKIYLHYLFRRCLRIFPAYWLQLLSLTVVVFFVPDLFSMPDGWALFKHIFLWLNLPPNATAPMVAVWWTLPVELMFYAVLPVMAFLGQRWSWVAVSILCLLICWLWRLGVMASLPGQDLSLHLSLIDALPGVLALFTAGFWAAKAHKQWKQPSKLALLALVGLILLETLLIRYVEHFWQAGVLLLVWPTACAFLMAVVVGCMAHSPPNWLVTTFMMWLGERSYGIYLWHLPVMLVISKSAYAQLPGIVVWSFVIAVTAILAELSYRIIEKKAMLYGKSF
jgi:peptidoglycan/LPS O-acetylase OafA/YrhL